LVRVPGDTDGLMHIKDYDKLRRLI